MYTSYYIESLPFNLRRLEARKVTENFPGLVPVVIEKVPTRLNMKSIRIRNVYPKGTTLREVCIYLRWLLRVREDAHFAICTQGVMPSLASDMGALYENFRHADGYLYLAYNDGTPDLRRIKVVEPLHSSCEQPRQQAPVLRSYDSLFLPRKIEPSPHQELSAQGRLLSPEDRSRNRPRSPFVERTDQFPQHNPDQSARLAGEEGALAMPEKGALSLPEEGALALPEEGALALPEEGASMTTSEDSDTDMWEEGTGEMSEHEDSEEDTDEDTIEDTDSLCSQLSFEDSSFGNYYLSDSTDSSSGSSDSSDGDHHSQYSYHSENSGSLTPERPQPLHGGPCLPTGSSGSSSDSYSTASEPSSSYASEPSGSCASFRSLSPHMNIDPSDYHEAAASSGPSTSQPRPTAAFSHSGSGPSVPCLEPGLLVHHSTSFRPLGPSLSYTAARSWSVPSLGQSGSRFSRDYSRLTHSLRRSRSAETFLMTEFPSSSGQDRATSESWEARPGPSSEE